VIEMTNSAAPKALGSEFDAFLFAAVGLDKNEMVVSVVSVFARQDIDPWQEAASLARLLQPLAASRLATLIATLPGGPPLNFDVGPGTARLIALLPGRHPIQNSPSVPLSPAGAAPNYPLIASLIVTALFMFGAQFVIASREDSAPPHKVTATIANPIPTKVPPSSAP
jgi:hypothetical protein